MGLGADDPPEHLLKRPRAARPPEGGPRISDPDSLGQGSPFRGFGNSPASDPPNPAEKVLGKFLDEADSDPNELIKKIKAAFQALPDGVLLDFKVAREDGKVGVHFVIDDGTLSALVVALIKQLG